MLVEGIPKFKYKFKLYYIPKWNFKSENLLAGRFRGDLIKTEPNLSNPKMFYEQFKLASQV